MELNDRFKKYLFVTAVGVFLFINLRGDKNKYAIKYGKVKFGLGLIAMCMIPYFILGWSDEGFANAEET